jgi:peroxiredoxin
MAHASVAAAKYALFQDYGASFHPPTRSFPMTIQVGDTLPAGTLNEFIEVEGNGCTIGPNTFKVEELVKGKKIAIFGLPGAYTPTCSAKHVPGYLTNYDALKAKGVDEIWCISVNDAFVMGAWGRDQKAGGKVRMMADGSADYVKKLGLTLDLTARGMGVRSDRFSMFVDNGIVKSVNREAPGKFEVSNAETLLGQI